MAGKIISLVLMIFCLVACQRNFGIPEKMSINDPRISPLWQAAEKFDRVAVGMEPIPKNGSVRVEWALGGGVYDAMLHLDYHEIAFRKTTSGFEWIWESQTYVGPNEYETADGPVHEEIEITYQTVDLSGLPLNKTVITYTGKDSRLLKSSTKPWNDDLTLAEVAPFIREWKAGSGLSK